MAILQPCAATETPITSLPGPMRGGRWLGWLAGGKPLDDAELGPLAPLDLKSLGSDLQQGAAQHVLLLQERLVDRLLDHVEAV